MQQAPAKRVSWYMKPAAVVVAIAAIAASIWYLRRPTPAKIQDSKSAAQPTLPRGPINRVTRLASLDQRTQLAAQIAKLQAERPASVPPTPSLPDHAVHAAIGPNLASESRATDKTEALKVGIRAAMHEVVPMLGECYEAEMDNIEEATTRVVAELTLTGDPDVGTLIDAHEMADEDGKPLPPKFDDCLRSTLQLLALPPLAEGDRVEVHYPFMFGKN